VVIEERVEIGGLQSGSGLKNGSSIIYKDDIPTGFIMHKNGLLKVYYGGLDHYDRVMPAYSALNIYFFKDNSRRVNLLLPRFPWLITWQQNFPSCNPPERWLYQYRYVGNFYEVDDVTEGDTVQFSYFSDWIATQEPFTYGVSYATERWSEGELTGWDIVFGNFDSCMKRYDNLLYIWIDVVNDVANNFDLIVDIEPSVLLPGDTADVIIKYKDAEGTLYNFPAEQSFELAVLDGCVNGNFMVGGVVDVYFEAAQQPIKFVTADNLDPEYDKVLIRVGTDLSGYSQPIGSGIVEEKTLTEKQKQLKTQFEKMIAEKKAEAEAKAEKTEGGNEPLAPVVTECALDNPSYEFNIYKNVLLQDECGNLPTEQQEIYYTLLEQPEFFKVPHSDEEELKLVELIQVCNDETHPHQNGGSIPVDYKRYRYNYSTSSFENSWRLEPYKGIDVRVHYNFVNPQTNLNTPLLFDFVTGVCSLKINPPGYPPKTLIDNLSDVNDPNKIPSNDYEQAFFDFCGNLCYPNERAVYVLIAVIRIHEGEHMNDFAGIVSESFPQLVEDIKSYRDLCQSYSETVRQNAEKVIYDMIYTFIREAKKDYQELSGEPGSPEELEHERNIQRRDSITSRIEDYKDELKMRFHQLVGRDCQNCSYE
jgi:hypothetical protein